jgi:adenylate kinase family enzyme
MLAGQGTKIDKVLNFAIDDAILEERITGRWIHAASGRSYHNKFNPPKVPGVDDVSTLEQVSFFFSSLHCPTCCCFVLVSFSCELFLLNS